MPISTIISTKKHKTHSEELSDKLDAAIEESEKQVSRFSDIKTDLDYDPDLVKKAHENDLVSDEDLQEAMKDTQEWKTQIKNDVKEAVMQEKRKQKAERKAQRKTLGAPEPSKSKSGGKKRRGKFI
ncbi:MAG: hypothetical protein KAG53_00685 [Endozoicomonadaceae bacterium]|nr:hypothetical protein [Endozoicomonadaceae bacterium]